MLVGKLVIWKTPQGYGVAYRCATWPAGNTELAWGLRDKEDGKGLRSSPFRYWLPDREDHWRQDPLAFLHMPELFPPPGCPPPASP